MNLYGPRAVSGFHGTHLVVQPGLLDQAHSLHIIQRRIPLLRVCLPPRHMSRRDYPCGSTAHNLQRALRHAHCPFTALSNGDARISALKMEKVCLRARLDAFGAMLAVIQPELRRSKARWDSAHLPPNSYTQAALSPHLPAATRTTAHLQFCPPTAAHAENGPTVPEHHDDPADAKAHAAPPAPTHREHLAGGRSVIPTFTTDILSSPGREPITLHDSGSSS